MDYIAEQFNCFPKKGLLLLKIKELEILFDRPHSYHLLKVLCMYCSFKVFCIQVALHHIHKEEFVCTLSSPGIFCMISAFIAKGGQVCVDWLP